MKIETNPVTVTFSGPMLVTQAPEPVVEADPEFPPVGAKLRFAVAGFNGAEESEGAIVEVLSHSDDSFDTTDTRGPDELPWRFGKDWRDGLELVTVDPVSGVTVPPELLPLPVAPEGKKWISRGRGFKWDGDKAIAAHGPYTGWDVFNGVTSHGVSENWFILELVDEASADERKPRRVTIHFTEKGFSVDLQDGSIKPGETIHFKESEGEP